MAMYPSDNIFNIYYNIGKRTPFQVKRSPMGLRGSKDIDYRYSQEGKTFMVEKVVPKGKYGKAYGYCMINGVRNDEYMNLCCPKDIYEIPCAGCGEWALIDVPNVDMDELFPRHQSEEILPFGKYKGKSIKEVYELDPQYIFWLTESDKYFRVDFANLTGIDRSDEHASEKFKNEIDRVFKVTIDDKIPFGKYKGYTYREIYKKDAQYIDWVLRTNTTLYFDRDSFDSLKVLI